MPGMPGAAVPPMSASQMSAPSKPLFPSAAAVSVHFFDDLAYIFFFAENLSLVELYLPI
jgi:hypothetical protein